MKKLLFLGLFFSMVYACGSGTESTREKRAETPLGLKIYKRYCVSCHGMYGNMGTSGAFDLTKSTLNMDEKISVITNGRKLMTAFKSILSEEEIKAVANYTEELKVKTSDK